MIENRARWRRNVALGLVLVLVLWFCWSIRSVLNPLLLGYLLAYILHPAVRRLEERGFSRKSAVLTIFLAGFLLMTGIVIGLFVQTRTLVRDVVTNPEVRAEISQRFEAVRGKLEERFGPEVNELWDTPGAALARLREFVQENRSAAQKAGEVTAVAAGGVVGFATRILGTLIAIGGLFVLVPLYTYYLLFELGRLHAWFAGYIPRGERERVTRVAAQIGEVLSSFFRGRLLVCLLKGAILTIGLFAVGVDYALLFGMLGGFLSIVPFVGPTLAFAGAFVIGVLDHGVLGSLLRTGAVFGAAELLEGYVLIPKIMGDSLGLHEVVVLFALLAGGAALGMFGILIALPVAAVVAILFREFVLPALRAWVEEDRRAPPARPGP